MKYQILRFQSEHEFQNFFGQLASAEITNFQAVEGSAGDGGFDGISDDTAYQVFYPEDKRRTEAYYIDKIDKDIVKVLKSIQELKLTIKTWILIVPEDLRLKVVAHLQKKSKETGITCIYWGATKLNELVVKYPHIQDNFPTLFLPPVQDGIKDIKRSLTGLGKSTMSKSNIEILTDEEFLNTKQKIRDEFQANVKPYYHNGRPDRNHLQLIIDYEHEAEASYRELKQKKVRSDKAFDLDLKDLEVAHEERILEINNEMARRGIYNSGVRLRELGKAEEEKQRRIERLKLTYGKTGMMAIEDKIVPPSIYISH